MVSEHEKLDIGKAYYKDGFRDGKAEGKAETARRMVEDGIPVEKVAMYTGLCIAMDTGARNCNHLNHSHLNTYTPAR